MIKLKPCYLGFLKSWIINKIGMFSDRIAALLCPKREPIPVFKPVVVEVKRPPRRKPVKKVEKV